MNGKRCKNRGTSTVAPDGMSYIDRGEISVDGKTWVSWFTTKFTRVQDSERSAVDPTVRDFEQAFQDYDNAKLNSLLTPDARWIENSLPNKIDRDWQWHDKAKAAAAGIRINNRPHDFETHVQGDVAWVTVTLDNTASADRAEGREVLLRSYNRPEQDCSSQGTSVSCKGTWVESMVLVKTPSGWKIALGHGSRLPKDQK